ncbi:hypothetical protein Hanom_Chr03g00207431 [Helianthus anomalus]
MVAHLLVVARNDSYAQGYATCSHHVVNALKSEDHVAHLKEIFPDREDDDEDLP